MAARTPPPAPALAPGITGGAQDLTGSATIVLAVLGVFVVYVPITAISAALTTIAPTTAAGTSDLQWVSVAYIIPMAATVLSAGVLGDIHGRRRMYVLGMSFTVAGAAAAGLADLLAAGPGLRLLWAGQAVSGIGAGILLPITLALIAYAVPDPRERGRYIGLWAMGLMLGLALGPLLSGGLLELTTWGWIFAPTACLALAAGVAARVFLPESRAAETRRTDWPGQAAATVAIATSIFGLVNGGRDGWSTALTMSALAVAAAAFAMFIRIELRSASPLMDLTLFRSATFAVASVSGMIALFAIVGTAFLLSLFLGSAQQLSPLEIGVRLLFISGIGVVVSPIVGVLMHRWNPLVVLTAGLSMAALGSLLLTGVDVGTGLADLAWRLAVFGVAGAVMLTAVSVAAVNAVPSRQAGMAAAASTALRQYGVALGPALAGSVSASRLRDGATPAAALQSALIVATAALVLAAVGAAAAALRGMRTGP